jgi:hypothetical protein
MQTEGNKEVVKGAKLMSTVMEFNLFLFIPISRKGEIMVSSK